MYHNSHSGSGIIGHDPYSLTTQDEQERERLRQAAAYKVKQEFSALAEIYKQLQKTYQQMNRVDGLSDLSKKYGIPLDMVLKCRKMMVDDLKSVLVSIDILVQDHGDVSTQIQFNNIIDEGDSFNGTNHPPNLSLIHI